MDKVQKPLLQIIMHNRQNPLYLSCLSRTKTENLTTLLRPAKCQVRDEAPNLGLGIW
jgi:hypothetical protein